MYVALFFHYQNFLTLTLSMVGSLRVIYYQKYYLGCHLEKDLYVAFLLYIQKSGGNCYV